MNMTIGRNLGGSSRRKLNLLIAACVAALSVSVAIALGTGGVWESGGSSSTAGTSAPALGQSLNQTTFSGAEFLGLGQPGEAVRSNEAAPFIDEWDFGSIGLDYLAPTAPHFGTAADAVYAAESAQMATAPVVLGDALGIGQPGEGVAVGEQAPIIDETDFGSLAAEYGVDSQLFGTAADGAYAAQGIDVVDPHFGTGVESVSALEADYLGIGQPGEGSTLGDPMVGQMVGPVYVIEDSIR
jgi:hypothetical protein